MKKTGIKRLIKTILALALVCALLLTCVYADDEIDSLEEENARLQEQISEEEDRIASLEESVADLEEYIAALNEEIDYIQSIIDDYEAQKNEKYDYIDTLNAHIADLEQQIADKEAEIIDKEEEIANEYLQMKKRIKFMYENVGNSYIEALFTSKTFSEAIEKIQYLLELTNYDRRQMQEIQAMKRAIQETKKAIEKDKETVQAEVKEVEEQVAAINELEEAQEAEQALIQEIKDIQVETLIEREAEINEAQEIINAMAAEIAANEDMIDTIVAEYEAELERQRQEAEARRLEAEQSGGEVDYEYYGSDQGFIWPLPGAYTTVTSTFGWRYDEDVLATGASTFHSGIDFYAPEGTPIYAVMDGIVVASDFSSGIGWYVAIYHGGGLYTECHHMCQCACVSVGEEVYQGETIGYTGATGWYCTGPHLHFGVCYGDSAWALTNNYVDPAPYLGIY